MISAKKREDKCAQSDALSEDQIGACVNEFLETLLSDSSALQQLIQSADLIGQESVFNPTCFLNNANEKQPLLSQQLPLQQQRDQSEDLSKLLSSPETKSEKQKSKENLQSSSSSSSQHKNLPKQQGFRYAKGAGERISMSEKSNICRESHVLSNSSPLSQSDQMLHRKSTCFSQYSNQSNQSNIHNNCTNNEQDNKTSRVYQQEEEESEDLTSNRLNFLRKNLFINSTSFTGEKQQAVSEGFNQGQTSPRPKQLTASTNCTTGCYQNSPQLSCTSSKSKENIILIQQPSPTNQCFLSGTPSDINTFSKKEVNSMMMLNNSEIPVNLSLQNKYDTDFCLEGSQIQKNPLQKLNSTQFREDCSEENTKNKSDFQQKFNSETLPYCSFIQPELVLPGLGASNDSVYMAVTLLMQSQNFVQQVSQQQHKQKQQQNNLINLDQDSSFQLTASPEQILEELNQLDFSQFANSVFRSNLANFQDELQQPKDFDFCNENQMNEIELEQNEEDIFQTQKFQVEQNMCQEEVGVIVEDVVDQQEFKDSQERETGNFYQGVNNLVQQENILQINQSSQIVSTSVPLIIVQQEQKKEESLAKPEQQKKGFQLSASHLNSKKGFQLRENITCNKSQIVQLKSPDSELKHPTSQIKQCKLVSPTQIIQNNHNDSANSKSKEQDSKSADVESSQHCHNEGCSSRKSNTNNNQFIYSTPDKQQQHQQLDQIQHNSSYHKIPRMHTSEICKYKKRSPESKKMEILTNQWLLLEKQSSALMAKYKQVSPNEKCKIQVIDVNALRKEEEEAFNQKKTDLTHHIIQEIEIQNPSKQRQKLADKNYIQIQCQSKSSLQNHLFSSCQSKSLQQNEQQKREQKYQEQHSEKKGTDQGAGMKSEQRKNDQKHDSSKLQCQRQTYQQSKKTLFVGDFENNSFDLFNELEYEEFQKQKKTCELTNYQNNEDDKINISLAQFLAMNSQEFNDLLQSEHFNMQQQHSSQSPSLTASPQMLIKIKRIQDVCQLVSTEGNDQRLIQSLSALNVMHAQNLNNIHHSSNISLIPEKSSCHSSIMSSSFMEQEDNSNFIRGNLTDGDDELEDKDESFEQLLNQQVGSVQKCSDFNKQLIKKVRQVKGSQKVKDLTFNNATAQNYSNNYIDSNNNNINNCDNIANYRAQSQNRRKQNKTLSSEFEKGCNSAAARQAIKIMGRKRKIHQSSTTSSEDQAFGEGEDNYLDDLPQQKYVNHNQDEISEEGDDDETKGNYEGDQDVRREQEEEEEEQESDNAQQEEENDDGEEEEENEDEHQQLNENSQVSKGAAALSDEQENNLSKKQINNQIEKKRKKVKKSQIIYGGRAPSPQYTRLAEIIMPDKYELYLSQVGGISRSNTLSSQSTQPIYSLTLSKQNSHQSASSTSEPKQQQLKQQQSKAQKKAAQKRKEKNAQNMDSTIRHDNEDEVKQKRKKSGKEDEMNEQMDEESSASGSQCQNKANAENQSIKNKFDTKNLVKNFLNQFLTFVHSEEEEKQVREIINMEDGSKFTEYKNLMKLFFKNKKFNRALLKEFVFVVDYRRLFLFFLQNRANDWIMQGRMKDKASHLRALQNFIYICENFSQIKSWRFRYNFV